MTDLESLSLNDRIRNVLDRKNFASVATLNPDGAPQASIVWVLRDGDAILFSVTSKRQKARNLERDPRVSLTIFDLENPYYSIEIRGTAEIAEDPERTLSKRLSQKYLGEDPPPEPDDVVRLMISVRAEKIIEFSP
jgi:PPOX class probable F420-dependent enzyme